MKRDGPTTMADMFFSGQTAEDEKQVPHEKKKYIPDPPGLQSAKAQRKARKQQLRQLQQALKRQQAEQKMRALESKVQDYWKAYAVWPQSWPEIGEVREDQNRFAEEFRSMGMIPAEAFKGDDPVKPSENVSRSFKIFASVTDGKVGIRSKPSTDTSCLTGDILHPGQLVVASNVVVVQGEKYVKLFRGGWVFESKDDQPVMEEVIGVEIGLWWYRVACNEFAEIRKSPAYYHSVRSGWIMCPGEVCVVNLRCTIKGSPWLQLADGRGWIFSLKSPQAMALHHEQSPIVMELCDQPKGDATLAQEAAEAIESESDFKAKSGVEQGLWQYQVLENPVLAIGIGPSGWWLSPGESFTVDLRAPANGQKVKEVSTKVAQKLATRIWLRLNDGRGWIPKNDASGRPFVRFTGFNPNPRKAPAAEFDTGESNWMQGVA